VCKRVRACVYVLLNVCRDSASRERDRAREKESARAGLFLCMCASCEFVARGTARLHACVHVCTYVSMHMINLQTGTPRYLKTPNKAVSRGETYNPPVLSGSCNE